MFVFDEVKVKEMPLVEIAYEVFKQSKKNYSFYDLVKEISIIKGLSEEETTNNLAQLFTELNIDGRFIHLGQNEWGLKKWFHVDELETLHLTHDEDEEDDIYDDEDYDDFDEEDDFSNDEDEEDIDEEDIDDEEDVEDDSLDEFDDDSEDYEDEELFEGDDIEIESDEAFDDTTDFAEIDDEENDSED